MRLHHSANKEVCFDSYGGYLFLFLAVAWGQEHSGRIGVPATNNYYF